MNKLEEMMKKEGWTLGYYINWGSKYWSFRKDGLDIDCNDITEVRSEKPGKHFTPWVEEVEVRNLNQEGRK